MRKRNRLWLIALTVLTVLGLLLWKQQLLAVSSLRPALIAQAPPPPPPPAFPEAPDEEPAAEPDASAPDGEPDTPVPDGETIAPPPTLPIAPPVPPPVILPAPSLPISGSYRDPGDRFQIAILDGYRVSSVGNAPLIEASDGRLAYTIVTVARPPISAPQPALMTSNEFVQMAREMFQRGEGLQITEFQPLAQGGVQMFWNGTLTIGGRAQPMQGAIVAQQAPANVFLLLVAATEIGAEQVPDAIATLVSSLELL